MPRQCLVYITDQIPEPSPEYFRCDKTGHFARECPDGEPEEREVTGELDRDKGSVQFKAMLNKDEGVWD